MPNYFEPGQLFRLNNSFNYGCTKGTVYQIDKISGDCIFTYKLGKGYKNVRKGNIRGNSFNVLIDKLINWVEQGAISFVELVEITKSEEYKTVVRRPKKQTGVSTMVVESAYNADNEAPLSRGDMLDKEYTITPDVDTRDNSPLWVVKFVEHMEREDFLAVREQIKELGGYYSRFKRGFIFNSDPTEILRGFSVAA